MTVKEFKIWLIQNDYTIDALADALNISTTTIYTYQRQGKFPRVFVLALQGLEATE